MKKLSSPVSSRHRRRGVTLLEILMALAILGFAWAAISRLTANGMKIGLRTEGDALAAMHCQSLMNAVLSGAIPLQNSSDQTLPGDENWLWSMRLAEMDQRATDLVTVRVTVQSRHRALTKCRCTLVQTVHVGALQKSGALP